MNKPVNIEKNSWEERPYTNQLYISQDISHIKPIKQIQAVCFDSANKIILYKHTKGWLGLPGGHVEEGESLEETLKRELIEEIACELEEWKIIAYEKIWWDDNPDDIFYFVRCWAKVKYTEQSINDPAHKSLERVVLSQEEALEQLGYGKKGKILIKAAIDDINSVKSTK